jgi:2-polyprenyl-6-hydroxyphenyl methylase/3-demethylubiquinone-9 3-methyltransferase
MGTAPRDVEEIRAGRRFAFGENWQRYLSVLDDARIREAEKSLQEFLELDSFAGKSFLDIGSGSGLFSLAARRLGATVVSFDNDPGSVSCTDQLRRQYFPGDPRWRVIHGSVLDIDFLKRLGAFDVVYAWGVLHHTGDMWRALENVTIATSPGSKLFIAIYNDFGRISRRWLKRKRRYNRLPRALRLPYACLVFAPRELALFARFVLRRNPSGYFDLWRQYQRHRGMSRRHDLIDWIGGYPYEFASADQLLAFFRRAQFRVAKLVPSESAGNHQIVLERT